MLNKAILQGRLTHYPELKHTTTGKAVTNFSIAVEGRKNADGERQVDFFRIQAWNAMAEFVCKYFDKGQPIIVEGRLATTTYTDDNDVRRKDVYVVADSVYFCGAKSYETQEKDIEAIFENDETDSIG